MIGRFTAASTVAVLGFGVLLASPAVVGASADAATPTASVSSDLPPGTTLTVPAEVFPDPDLTAEVHDLVFSEANLDGSLVDVGGRRFRLDADVLFAFDRSDLTPKANAILGELATRLRQAGATRLGVDGYTDAVGEAAYNLELSRRRAEAVGERLRDLLGRAVTITPTGHGEDDPIASNDTRAGQAHNRRVTIAILN